MNEGTLRKMVVILKKKTDVQLIKADTYQKKELNEQLRCANPF